MSAVQLPPGKPDLLLDSIDETFWALGVVAEIGRREAQLGDLGALSHAVRRAVALTRFLTATASDCRDLAERQPREPGRTNKQFTTVEPA